MGSLGYLRKAIRFLVATAVWLHALFLLNVVPPPLAPAASRLGLSATELLLVLLIVGIGLLKVYGAKRLLVDLLYVYFFPFIAPCLLIYWLVISIKAITAFFQAPSSRLITSSSDVEVKPASTARAPIEGWLSPAFRALPTVVLSFTALWGLLVVYTTHDTILRVATGVVMVGIVRILYRVLKFGIFSTDWLSELESRMQQTAENWIASILAWQDSTAEPSSEVKQAWTGLRALQVGVHILRNKQRVIQWTIGLGLGGFAVVYVYVAVLFSFAYVGISRISIHPYSWHDALVTSLLLPISFSELPHAWAVRLAGAVQYLFLVVFGVGTVAGYLRRKLKAIETAAALVSLRMQEEVVKKQFVALEKKLGQPAAIQQGKKADTA